LLEREVQAYDGNMAVDLWALFPWLQHSKIHVTVSFLLQMQCGIVYVLFIYDIINVSKGVHSHAKHCLSQTCLVSAQFSGYHQTCISKTHDKNYTNYLQTFGQRPFSWLHRRWLETSHFAMNCVVNWWTPLDILLYCSNPCNSLHFKILKSHNKTLKIRPHIFQSLFKQSSGVHGRTLLCYWIGMLIYICYKECRYVAVCQFIL
jgi:hypothetical protein